MYKQLVLFNKINIVNAWVKMRKIVKSTNIVSKVTNVGNLVYSASVLITICIALFIGLDLFGFFYCVHAAEKSKDGLRFFLEVGAQDAFQPKSYITASMKHAVVTEVSSEFMTAFVIVMLLCFLGSY